MNEQQRFVFNQYYIDLLKKTKSAAKDKKDTSKEARDILRAIKKYYASMDKLSPEYMDFLVKEAFWENYTTPEYTETFLAKHLYEEITVQQINKVLEPRLLAHFLCLMDIFREATEVEETSKIVNLLATPKEYEEKVNALEDSTLQAKLRYLSELHKKKNQAKLEDGIKEIENTSLGALAKEIMKDIDVDELQRSFSDPNTNILGSLQDPNSGLGKMIGTVSQSMISKLASGEIKQETLLQDAMSLASKLPGMLPGGMGSAANGLGGLGAMLQQFQNMGGLGGEGGGLGDLMKNFTGAQRNAAGSRMNSAARRQKTADRLRKKISKRDTEDPSP
jgi:hypothetical protein